MLSIKINAILDIRSKQSSVTPEKPLYAGMVGSLNGDRARQIRA